MTNSPDALPLDDEYIQNTHEFEAKLRIESPVRRAVTPRGMTLWLVTRYQDVKEILVHPNVKKDSARATELMAANLGMPANVLHPAYRLVESHMLNTDPPHHTRLRKLVNKAFTTRAIARLRPRIESITETLLDDMAGQDTVDLVAAFAAPLPIRVICELLGVPENERGDFRAWTNVILSSVSDDSLVNAAVRFTDYLTELVARKRAEPTEDLLSDLAAVTDNGDQLSERELVGMASLLVIAGHDTTVNLISNGILTLLRAPEQFAALRADPALMPGAVEELLRYEGPVHMTTTRFTVAPVTVGGVEIPANEFVGLSLTSANRDGERFDDPDRFDITRHANGHVAFGHGIHHCLGAPLARLEGQIAIGALISRFPDLRLAVEEETLTWRFSTLMHGLEALPVHPR